MAITAQLLAECGYALERATQLGDLWQLFARETGQNPLAKWIERDESGQEFTCLASPLAMGPWLQRVLWERCAGAIMVSATLTAMNSFSLFRDHTGLRSDDGTIFLRLASPFDYQRAELLIPHMPCEPSSADFTAALIATLPTRMARLQAQNPKLVIKDPPFYIPEFELKMAWCPLLHHHPAHRWLRQLILFVARQMIEEENREFLLNNTQFSQY